MKKTLIINEEFKNALPSLRPIEYLLLEMNILENGCREPLTVWKNQIVDGHQRYKICQKHNLDFEVTEKSFSDDEDAKFWIIGNQLKRRNLNNSQFMLYLGKLYQLSKKTIGAQLHNQNATKPNIESSDARDVSRLTDTTSLLTVNVSTLNLETRQSTAEILAKKFNINEKTVRRAGKIVEIFEKVDEEVRESFLKDEISQKSFMQMGKPLAKEPNIIAIAKEYVEKRNTEIEWAYNQGIRMEKMLNIFKEQFNEVRQVMPPEGVVLNSLETFYTETEQYFMKIQNVCDDLKRRFTCEHCEAMGCVKCDEAYLSSDTYALQIKAINENPHLRDQLKKVENPGHCEPIPF